jgi:hypothetical protein
MVNFKSCFSSCLALPRRDVEIIGNQQIAPSSKFEVFSTNAAEFPIPLPFAHIEPPIPQTSFKIPRAPLSSFPIASFDWNVSDSLSDHAPSSTRSHTPSDNDDTDSKAHYADELLKINVIRSKHQSLGTIAIIDAQSTVDLDPDKLYELICHPEKAKVFRGIKRITYRKIIDAGRNDSSSGDGDTTPMSSLSSSLASLTASFTSHLSQHLPQHLPPSPPPSSYASSSSASSRPRKIETAHEAFFRFLLIKGHLTTRLIVEESEKQRQFTFSLMPGAKGPGAVFTHFKGTWKVDPHPTKPGASVTSLSQELALRRGLPPGLMMLMSKICCGQVRQLFEDLQSEAGKIQAGRPTITTPYHLVKNKEIL